MLPALIFRIKNLVDHGSKWNSTSTILPAHLGTIWSCVLQFAPLKWKNVLFFLLFFTHINSLNQKKMLTLVSIFSGSLVSLVIFIVFVGISNTSDYVDDGSVWHLFFFVALEPFFLAVVGFIFTDWQFWNQAARVVNLHSIFVHLICFIMKKSTPAFLYSIGSDLWPGICQPINYIFDRDFFFFFCM